MRRRPPDSVIITVLAGLGMIGPFSTDTIFPAFAEMGTEFGASEFALQQLVAVYLVSYAALSLFHGSLSDARGRRPVIIGGLAIYLLGCVGAALAQSLEFLLVMRALQGAGAGASQIIGRAMIRDYFSGQKAQKMMANVTMIFALAPAAAPIIGGLILGFADWRAIFWFLVAWAALMILATLLLPEPVGPDKRVPFSARQVMHGLAVVWSNPDGRRLAINAALHFGGTFLYISSAPLIMGLLGQGEQDYWKLFVPIVAGLICGSYISGRLSAMSGRRLATMGYVIGSVGLLANLLFALLPATQGLPWAVAALPIFTLGMGIAFPILNLAMLDLYPDNRGAAASVQGFAGLLVNAVIAGLVAPLLGGSMITLALGAIAMFGAAWIIWTRHLAATRVVPTSPDAAS